LSRHGVDNTRMAVAHGWHVVIGVEITCAVGSEEPNAFAADEVEGA